MKEPGHPETAPPGFLIKSQGSAPSRPLCLCPVPGRGGQLMLHMSGALITLSTH